MPIRHGGRLASRVSTCPRDHFCRSTIAPRRSWPTTWNDADHGDCAVEFLRHGVLLDFGAPGPASLAGGGRSTAGPSHYRKYRSFPPFGDYVLGEGQYRLSRING